MKVTNYLKELEKFEENKQQKTSVSSVSEATAKSQKAKPLIDKTFTSSVGSVSTSVSKGGCQSEFDFSNTTYLSINKEKPPLVGNKTIKNNFKNATDKADKTDRSFTADKPGDFSGIICGRCQQATFMDTPDRFCLFCQREQQPVVEMRSCPLDVWQKDEQGYQINDGMP